MSLVVTFLKVTHRFLDFEHIYLKMMGSEGEGHRNISWSNSRVISS